MSDFNQYQAPSSQVDRGSTQEFGEVKIFGVSGRIGRVRFLAYFMGVNVVLGLITTAVETLFTVTMGESGAPIMFGTSVLLIIAQLVLYFMFAIQRSHDMNVSGWLSLILLIPVIGFLVFLIAPGTSGENNYGAPPPPNTAGVIILALLIPIVAIIGILAAIAIPAYQSYVEKAQEAQQQQQYEQQR